MVRAILAALALPTILTPALAAPAVVADIAPVHSLVARVMEGVGEPALIVPPGASEHHLALKPSQSAALGEAEVVFWVGPELEPWLEAPLQTLAGDARVIALLHSPGTARLPLRADGGFTPHVHDGADGSGMPEETGDAAAHDHDHPANQTAGPQDAGQPGPGPRVGAEPPPSDPADPHAWLDPGNAEVWLGTIAETLSDVDPVNAAIYVRNAEAGRAELAALDRELAARLEPVSGVPFVVFHDAYQYFEARFDLSVAGSISLADGSAPGPARLAAIRAEVQALRVTCALSEPQYDPGLIETVFEGTEVKLGVVDPLGAMLEPGPKLYPALLRGMASSVADCAG